MNNNYFDNWSHDMAYILGFITGDGSVSKYYLKIGLNIKDISVLDFIKSELNIQTKYYYRNQQCKNIISHQVTLQVGSIKLIQKLSEFGIIKNKTGKEILPDIPTNYKFDYLRGIFDADGCFSKRFCIVSKNRKYLEDIKTNICLNYGNITNSAGCFDYSIYKKECIKYLYNKMYSTGNFYLARKKTKIEEFLV